MRYLLIALGLFGLDEGVKNYIEKQEDLDVQDRKAGRFLIIRKHHNRGLALNMGDKRQKLIAILSLAMTILLTVFFIITLGHKGNTLLRTGLSFLLGGAFGNTYDRLKRKYVVDYVSFNVPFKGLRSIVFNIADFCIMIGALLTVIGAGGD